jgi:membrane protein DedA with SNARE-associated domain
MTDGVLTNVTEGVVSVIETLGAPGAGLLIALENLFPPLPSEVILPLAVFSASRGDLSLAAALIWTTIGSVAGALALYWIGARIGRDRLRAIVDRLPLLKLSDVDRTEVWFARHGGKAVFLGRMVPVFRSLISIPAGVNRMRLSLFLLYTTLGSAIWNTAFILAGYALGENWHVVEDSVGVYSRIVLALAVLALAVFVVRRARRARAEKATTGESKAGGEIEDEQDARGRSEYEHSGRGYEPR